MVGVNAQDALGDTPLHVGVRPALFGKHGTRPQIAILLLQHGADPHIPNQTGETPAYLIEKALETALRNPSLEAQAQLWQQALDLCGPGTG